MKILQISVNDFGGCGYYLAEAIKATTKHDSISCRQSAGSYIKYPTHVVGVHADDMVAAWEWADVVHIHDVLPQLPPTCKSKPAVITYHGSMYRRNPTVYHQYAEQMGWLGTVATIDLTVLSLTEGLTNFRWMPDTRPLLSKYIKRVTDRFIIAHAPTSRVVKDTEKVIEQLGAMEGVHLDIIERVDYDTCLTRKGRASLYIDQFRLCYGLNAIEAWVMGIPVIADAGPRVLDEIKRRVDYVPFVRSSIDDLAATVERLRTSPQDCEEAAEAGWQAFERFHSPQAAAKIAMKFYQEAIERDTSRLPYDKRPYVPRVYSVGKVGRGVRPKPQFPSIQGKKVMRYVGGNSAKFTVRGNSTDTLYQICPTADNPQPLFYIDERDIDTFTAKSKISRRTQHPFEVIG